MGSGGANRERVRPERQHLGARSALLAELSALDEQRARLAQQRGRAILEDAEAILRAAGVTQVAARLRIGDIVDTVAEVAGDAGMLVIGKRGEAANFAKLHLGSNLERVVRSSSKPVYIAARAFRPLERVLLAFDGGPSSMRAVDHVARDALFAGLEVRLLTVGPETPDARRRIDDARAILEAGGHAVRADILPGGPVTVIAATVEQEGIDLLVMGASGRSRLRALFIGSTATEMIRSCKIPILVFR